MDEDKSVLSSLSESNLMGKKNLQELFDRFDLDLYLIEASFFFK